MYGEWCSGSGEWQAGVLDRCLDCGRAKHDDGRPIIDQRTGKARRHMALPFAERRRRGLIPSQIKQKAPKYGAAPGGGLEKTRTGRCTP